MPNMTKAKLRVTGRVQGVFYRQTTQTKASELGLGGWIRNTDDGAVELEVWGPAERVERLIAWCQIGPPSAKVSAVEVEWRKDLDDHSADQLRFQISH
jgi:acylphosphatase